MPKNTLVYNGNATASTSDTIIYTCPTLTVAEVRMDIRWRYISASTSWSICVNGGTSSPASNNFNIRVSMNNSTAMREQLVVYKNDSHILGQQIVYSPSCGDGQFTDSDSNRLYWTESDREPSFNRGSSTQYPFRLGPKFYMTPGDRLVFNADSTTSGNLIFYNFVVIEEASTLT